MNFGVLTYVLLVTSSPVAPGTTVGKTCFSNPKCDEHHFCSHFHCTQTVFRQLTKLMSYRYNQHNIEIVSCICYQR